MNSSNSCYTSGEHNIISIKTGSNKTLLSDYTYCMNISFPKLYNKLQYD